ncbi:hypothetical protein [Haloferax sulfurifontis]|uniref:Uncharacterized protein n=1 Tax=Haloferax sulfurifontis TaxID=255616 RepID=A0A830DYG5_9EURY|nr:hypothetical protein [Haloferax sulfurifontis]GGC53068.1 hypothetical protein GCM10007209_13490 [Haloferax sulfurifontis]
MPEDGETPTPPSPGDTFVRNAGVPNAGGAANHAAAEGAQADAGESDGDSSKGVFAALFDADATGPAVSQLRSEYPDLPRGSHYLLRMLIRVSGGDGTPPVVDGAVGTTLLGLQYLPSETAQDGGEDESDSSSDEGVDDDLAPLAGVGGA